SRDEPAATSAERGGRAAGAAIAAGASGANRSVGGVARPRGGAAAAAAAAIAQPQPHGAPACRLGHQQAELNELTMPTPLLVKTLVTAGFLCSAAMLLRGPAQSGDLTVSAAARPDFAEDLSARFLIGQAPTPAAMPMPIPVVRPEIHPRIQIHVQQPEIDAE